jgi:RHS repeat-associated protein
LTTGGSSGQGDRCAGHHLAGTTPSCLSVYRLGSTQSVADSAGNEVGRAIYTPFGEPIVNTIPPQVTDRLFTGQRWDDAAGLYDYSARMYDPQIGQFTQPDPFIDGDTAIGWNRYAYAHNAPTTYVDPSGNFIWDILDPFQFAWSLAKFIDQPSSETLGALVLDAIGILPYIPAIGALRHADDVSDLARAADVGEDLGGARRAASRLEDVGSDLPRLRGPGEDLYVGPYGKSYRANVRAGVTSEFTPHHVRQAALSPVSRWRGTTINIRRGIHAPTRTISRLADLGLARTNLAADIHDLRVLLRAEGYDPHLINRQLQELIRQEEAIGGLLK